MTEEERQRERLSARLKEYRKLMKLSQAELAKKLGKAHHPAYLKTYPRKHFVRSWDGFTSRIGTVRA